MKIRLHADAEHELLAASVWYDAERPGLGDEMLAEVQLAIAAIVEAPHAWPTWPDAPDLDPAIRRFLLRRFPFSIGYQVADDELVILTIAHMSRRPRYWASRAR
ncbi:MAG: type II toxin-antitoxin system RelE/ParE family toxin [Myxococcota bacterium]|nr:type II toxin-antitoxin system RelE/ParE family toxin [Myxococcota bacterium]